MVTTSIFLDIHMNIELTRLLKDNAPTAKFYKDKRLCIGSINLDWNNNAIIKEVIATNKEDEDKIENL